jgi:hypothetical protein
MRKKEKEKSEESQRRLEYIERVKAVWVAEFCEDPLFGRMPRPRSELFLVAEELN